MSREATISAGSATVPSSGFYTQQGIDQVGRLLDIAGVVTVGYGPGMPSVGSPGVHFAVVGNGAQSVPGVVSLPAGYAGIEIGTGNTVTLTGGGAGTTVISGSNLTYAGSAQFVEISGGPNGTLTGAITDDADGAVLALGGGSFSVTARGDRQTLQVDNGVASIVATGNGDVVELGDALGSAAFAPGGAKSDVLLSGTADVVNIRQRGAHIYDAGGSTTINGISGTATIFAATGDVYRGTAGSAEFIGLGSTQTVFGGSGSDTVFGNVQDANAKIYYEEGSGANNVFVDGVGSATVIGNTTGASGVFGGDGSLVEVLHGAQDTFVGVGHGGSDTIMGGSGSATIFGAGANESIKLIGGARATLVDLGEGEKLDASQTEGGNAFWVLSTTGNATLTGAATGSDSFVVVQTIGGAAHTITVENWHAGDTMILSGYGDRDVAAADAAIGSGSARFLLSDGTTIDFVGTHPTHGNGGALT